MSTARKGKPGEKRWMFLRALHQQAAAVAREVHNAEKTADCSDDALSHAGRKYDGGRHGARQASYGFIMNITKLD